MPSSRRGSHFSFEKPLTPVSLGGTLRILYVESAREPVANLIQEVGPRGWEISHAPTATIALEIARKQPVDVALLSASVTDTDLVDLAGDLTQIHPKLTTFILGDDVETSQAYVTGRYQFFPELSDPAPLIAAIERMATLVSWLTNNTTIDLVSGIHSLPTIPSNYQGVIRIINSPNASIQEIGDAMEKDMGMTSRVLQVANSAYYGFSKSITSPTQAALLIGVETLKSLVRYTHVLNNFPHSPASTAIFDRVWRHSINVASVARRITMLHTKDENLAEEAFTAGLLHDIGKLVLISIKPDEYRDVMRQSAENKSLLHVIERVKLGTTHAETGAYLLSLWGLPYSILEAVAWHHYPSSSNLKQFSPLTAVHVANVAEHRRQDIEDVKAIPPLDDRYLAELEVTNHVQEWLNCKPDQPGREDIAMKPYIVQADIPTSLPEAFPTWAWGLIGAAAAIGLVILFKRSF
jgi:HD-like signal output (HDOD) protein